MNQKKTFRSFILKNIFLVLAMMTAGVLQAQDSKETSVKNMLDSKQFIFKAQTVLPQRGATRQLTSEYDVKVLGDSVISYLPYFGRAYTAPIGNSDGGLQFTSTSFSYDIKEKKKDWEITIIPKDAGDVRQLFFTVFSNGSASLHVISNNREPISFNGRVESIK